MYVSHHWIIGLYWSLHLWNTGYLQASAFLVSKVEACGVRVPLRSRHFLSQKLRHFHKNIRSCVEMNAVARAQLTFHIITLLQKYLYRQSECSKTRDSKCLALIAKMVEEFSMNPKIGGSSPPQVETFSVSKTLSVCVSKINAVACAQIAFQMLTLFKKN